MHKSSFHLLCSAALGLTIGLLTFERTQRTSMEKIDTRSFYQEYHGHDVDHLKSLTTQLRRNRRPLCFLVGDSTMDNKYWFKGSDTWDSAVNGYEHILTEQRMKKDVAYWVNRKLVDAGRLPMPTPICINAAIEESALRDRDHGGVDGIEEIQLRRNDKFVHDNLQEDDIVICSIGGNDIALRANLWTGLSMLAAILSASIFGAPTPGDGTAVGVPMGLSYFIHLFGERTQRFLEKLIAKKKPKLVLVCMLYHLDQDPNSPSWAGHVLSFLRYNSQPELLKSFIETVFELGTRSIQLEGTKVVPVPMFRTLDGTIPGDYVARVEPSVQGGEKLGALFADLIRQHY